MSRSAVARRQLAAGADARREARQAFLSEWLPPSNVSRNPDLLLEAAKRVLPAEHKFDGQTTRQIQEAVMLHIDSSLDFKDRTDEFVAARFDGVISARASTQSNLDDARRVSSPAKRMTARADSKEPPVPDWQKPLSYSRAPTKLI